MLGPNGLADAPPGVLAAPPAARACCHGLAGSGCPAGTKRRIAGQAADYICNLNSTRKLKQMTPQSSEWHVPDIKLVESAKHCPACARDSLSAGQLFLNRGSVLEDHSQPTGLAGQTVRLRQ